MVVTAQSDVEIKSRYGCDEKQQYLDEEVEGEKLATIFEIAIAILVNDGIVLEMDFARFLTVAAHESAMPLDAISLPQEEEDTRCERSSQYKKLGNLAEPIIIPWFHHGVVELLRIRDSLEINDAIFIITNAQYQAESRTNCGQEVIVSPLVVNVVVILGVFGMLCVLTR